MVNLATSSAISGGDLDLSVTFLANQSFWAQDVVFYVWSLSTPDGECSLRFVDYDVVLRVRGADVLLSDGLVTPTAQGWQTGDVITLRAWYKPRSLPAASAGLRFTVNGCTSPDDTSVSASGAPLNSATEGYFASYMGTTYPMLATLQASSGGAAGAVAPVTPEFVQLGDSTSNAPSIASPMCGTIYAPSEIGTRPGILSFAMSGETTSQQLSRFQASPQYRSTQLKAIIVQSGINDNEASGKPLYRASVAAIKADNPGAKVLTAKTIPWNDPNVIALNADITAGITGADGSIVSHYPVLGGGADSLLPQYVFQVGQHDNYAGRLVNGGAYRDALRSLGLLSQQVTKSPWYATSYAFVGHTPIRLYAAYASNANAVARYFQIFDKSTEPAVGDVPISQFTLQPNGGDQGFGEDMFTASGIGFRRGFSWGISATRAIYTPATAADHDVWVLLSGG